MCLVNVSLTDTAASVSVSVTVSVNVSVNVSVSVSVPGFPKLRKHNQKVTVMLSQASQAL
jgi:hypothetical protein